MTDDLTFSKEDYAALRETAITVKNLDEKIDKLTVAISACQSNCSDRRDKIDKRVRSLETFRTQILATCSTISLAVTLGGGWVMSHFKV